ncbi:hypothetical protein, partial [Pseudoalteromonas tunicata]|uniref:hypothetical protein n=1 Tax=Pseudoalteromonas tunicata TaxID=314281 RepID=UPI00273DFDCA
ELRSPSQAGLHLRKALNTRKYKTTPHFCNKKPLTLLQTVFAKNSFNLKTQTLMLNFKLSN